MIILLCSPSISFAHCCLAFDAASSWAPSDWAGVDEHARLPGGHGGARRGGGTGGNARHSTDDPPTAHHAYHHG